MSHGGSRRLDDVVQIAVPDLWVDLMTSQQVSRVRLIIGCTIFPWIWIGLWGDLFETAFFFQAASYVTHLFVLVWEVFSQPTKKTGCFLFLLWEPPQEMLTWYIFLEFLFWGVFSETSFSTAMVKDEVRLIQWVGKRWGMCEVSRVQNKFGSNHFNITYIYIYT